MQHFSYIDKSPSSQFKHKINLFARWWCCHCNNIDNTQKIVTCVLRKQLFDCWLKRFSPTYCSFVLRFICKNQLLQNWFIYFSLKNQAASAARPTMNRGVMPQGYSNVGYAPDNVNNFVPMQGKHIAFYIVAHNFWRVSNEIVHTC